MQSLGGQRDGVWKPPILKTVAARGEGIDDVLEALERHRAWMTEHDELARRRLVRAAAEIEAIALGTVKLRFGQVHGSVALEAAAARVVDGDADPYTAAEELVATL
jgi:LAO/AO transport system kinase